MIKIEQKLLSTVPPEVLIGLFDQHWNEVYGAEEKHKADIAFDHYYAMENANVFFSLFALYDNTIVGYSGNFIAPNLHSRGRLSCNNDSLYVDPLFRDTPLGLKLIRGTEKEAKNRGADQMVWNAPINTALVNILPKLKYKEMEKVFLKEI